MFDPNTQRVSKQVRARSLEDDNQKFAHFTFEYNMEQPQLLFELQAALVKALNYTLDDKTEKLVISARIGDDAFVIGGDAQLRNALLSSRADEEIELLVSRRRRSMGSAVMAKKSIMIHCSLALGEDPNVAQDSASIKFTWIAGSEDDRAALAADLLKTLKDELLDALDQFGSDAKPFALHFKLDKEWVPISGDRVVFDVLTTLNAAGSQSLEARLSITPPKPPVTRLKLRCVFEGVTREAKQEIEVADDVLLDTKNPTSSIVLPLLVSACKALWPSTLSAADQVTLFNAVPPTDFKNAALCDEAGALDVAAAARKSYERKLFLRMERGNVLPQHQAVMGPTRVQTLYYDNEKCRFEQEAEFDFSWPAHGHGSFAALAEKVRSLLHLTVAFDMFLGTDARGEVPPMHLKNDHNVKTFLASAPATTQLFCIKSSLDAGNSTSMLEGGSSTAVGNATVGPLPVGRASFIRALVEDWKQILPRSNRSGTSSATAGPPVLTNSAAEEREEEERRKQPVRLTADAMRPVIATWHHTWELHRRELQLLDTFEQWAAAGGENSVAVDELFTLLMRWTAYLVDDEVANFARHGQSMIDWLTEVSNEARCMRLSAKVFAALRTATSNRVDPARVVKAIVASGTVANKADVEQVVAQYDDEQASNSHGIEQWELDEILTYFFLDDSAAYARLLAAATALRTTPDYSQHDTQMRAVREARLRSELRHALDGIVPAHLVKFAKDHYGLSPAQVPAAYQELAWCVATLLRHSSAAESAQDTVKDGTSSSSFSSSPRLRSWRWLIGECASETAAADLLAVLRTTGLSYCSDDTLQEVGVVVFNDGIDARFLHTKAGAFFSNLAQWTYVLQDLTFLVRGLQLKVTDAASKSLLKEHDDTNDDPKSTAAGAVLAATSGDGDDVTPQKSSSVPTVPPPPPPRGSSPLHNVRYSPPRATVALRRAPQPPAAAAGSPKSAAAVARSGVNTTRAIVPSGASAVSASGLSLTPRRPEQDLAALLRAQKEEHLIREFAADESVAAAAAASGSPTRDSAGGSSTSSMPRTKNNAEYAMVTIKGAAGLVKHSMVHSVDSYIVAYNSSGAVVHQTPVVEGTTSPRFPAQCRFVIPLCARAGSTDLGSVVFHVLTESTVAGFLGEATLKLAEATLGGTRDIVLRIKPRRGETDELLLEHAMSLGHLTIELVPMRQPIFLPRGEPGFVVSGVVESACSLPPLQRQQGNFLERRDMYVQIMDGSSCPVGRTEPATNRAKEDGSGALNPVWSGLAAEFVVPLEQVALPATSAGPGGLRFQLIDEDLRGGRIFGSATLLPNMLVDNNNNNNNGGGGGGTRYKLKVVAETATSRDVPPIPYECAITVTAQVLGPLADDIAHRKRQEEARRLALQRAEELAIDKRRREEEESERTRGNEEYIQAAQREADRQRSEHAAKVRAQQQERSAAEQKQRDAEAQAKAKMAAMAAALAENDDEHTARRRQVHEAEQRARAAEQGRMATIDREMQRMSEAEMRQRIQRQLEQEEADHRRFEEEEHQRRRNNATNNSESSPSATTTTASGAGAGVAQAADESPKSQQEVAESCAKDQMKRLLAQQEAEERSARNAAALRLIEKEEEEDARPMLEQEYEQWIVAADKLMLESRRELQRDAAAEAAAEEAARKAAEEQAAARKAAEEEAAAWKIAEAETAARRAVEAEAARKMAEADAEAARKAAEAAAARKAEEEVAARNAAEAAAASRKAAETEAAARKAAEAASAAADVAPPAPATKTTVAVAAAAADEDDEL